MPGCELTTFHGHHPVYGFADIVPWHIDGRIRPLEEMQADVRGRGGLVSVAHPFKVGDPYCTGCRMRDDLPPASFDMIEVWFNERRLRDWVITDKYPLRDSRGNVVGETDHQRVHARHFVNDDHRRPRPATVYRTRPTTVVELELLIAAQCVGCRHRESPHLMSRECRESIKP